MLIHSFCGFGCWLYIVTLVILCWFFLMDSIHDGSERAAFVSWYCTFGIVSLASRSCRLCLVGVRFSSFPQQTRVTGGPSVHGIFSLILTFSTTTELTNRMPPRRTLKSV